MWTLLFVQYLWLQLLLSVVVAIGKIVYTTRRWYYLVYQVYD